MNHAGRRKNYAKVCASREQLIESAPRKGPQSISQSSQVFGAIFIANTDLPLSRCLSSIYPKFLGYQEAIPKVSRDLVWLERVPRAASAASELCIWLLITSYSEL